MRISDWSSDVCSSDLLLQDAQMLGGGRCGETDLLDDVAADAGAAAQQRLHDLHPRGVCQRLGKGCELVVVGRRARGRGSSRSLRRRFDSHEMPLIRYSTNVEYRVHHANARGKIQPVSYRLLRLLKDRKSVV